MKDDERVYIAKRLFSRSGAFVEDTLGRGEFEPLSNTQRPSSSTRMNDVERYWGE
jgi:hypothetical protein